MPEITFTGKKTIEKRLGDQTLIISELSQDVGMIEFETADGTVEGKSLKIGSYPISDCAAIFLKSAQECTVTYELVR